MNSKILLAFVAGALLASGIVYMAVRPEPALKPVSAAAIPAKQDSPAAVVDPAPSPAASAPLDETLPPSESPKAHAAKPSPPVRKKTEVAKVIPPAQPAPPSTPALQQDQLAVVQLPPAVEPPPAPAPAAEPAPAPQPPPAAPTVTIPAGTVISVRVGETLTTQKNQTGDTFLATLAQPLVADGFVIAEKGARAEGRIVDADRAGKVKGLSHLTVELTKITTSDGQHIRVRTSPFNKEGTGSSGTDAAKVGGGAALGAIIGAIAGGGKGAGIGAGVGGAAGAGDVLMTRGKDAVIPVETRLAFNLQEPITLTEHGR